MVWIQPPRRLGTSPGISEGATYIWPRTYTHILSSMIFWQTLELTVRRLTMAPFNNKPTLSVSSVLFLVKQAGGAAICRDMGIASMKGHR